MSLNVFVSSPVEVQRDIFNLWLSGCSVEKAVRFEMKDLNMTQQPKLAEYLKGEINDHYRNFSLLVHFLKHPSYFSTQCLFQLSSANREFLIESYYNINEVVLRELLGKKLTARLRKEIDDISERVRVPLFRCKTQFDNLRRILRTVEDMSQSGGLVENIQENFTLSHRLAQRYSRVIFMCSNRIDASKKRLSSLTFSNFEFCIGVMMDEWSPPGVSPGEDLDMPFFSSVRELRNVILDKLALEHFRELVLQDLKDTPSFRKDLHQYLPKTFKTILRNLFTIGAGLTQSKELRDFFVDIDEKIIDFLKPQQWKKEDIGIFFKSVLSCFPRLQLADDTVIRRLNPILKRFLAVMDPCIQELIR